MKSRYVHIALIALVAFGSVTVAFADKSKKDSRRTSDAGRRTTEQAMKAASPTVGAVDVVVSSMNRKSMTKQSGTTGAKIKVTSDTVRRESRILFAMVSSDVFKTKVDIGADQQNIDIGIYNMLGKRMGDVYNGPASRGEHEYTMSVSDLPEGVYICILQSGNFRRAEKFYLNR